MYRDIAADFSQQWHESDRLRFEPFVENVVALFVDRVLAGLPSKSITPSQRERSVCECMYIRVCVRERNTYDTPNAQSIYCHVCVCERERQRKGERERQRERESKRKKCNCVDVHVCVRERKKERDP